MRNYWQSSEARGSDVVEGACVFTIHRRSGIGAIFGFIAGATVLEAALVHLLVARWSRPAAWVLTAVNLYGAIWLAGIARSFAERPVVAAGDCVLLRRGRLAEARVRRSQIAEVTDSAIVFTEPVEIVKLGRIRRRATEFPIELDDPAEFRAWVKGRPPHSGATLRLW